MATHLRDVTKALVALGPVAGVPSHAHLKQKDEHEPISQIETSAWLFDQNVES